MLQSNSFLSMVRNESLTNRIIMLILLCYPALLLTVRGSVGIAFFILLVISVISLYRMRGIPSISHWDNYSIAFSLAMASPTFAIVLSQTYFGEFYSPAYDSASRFLLAIPIFLVLRQMKVHTLTALQFGLPVGVLIGLAILIRDPFIWDINRHTTSKAFNLIHFSNTVLMLGFLSLMSINWNRKDPTFILALKFCGFLAAVYMSAQTGERGSWIAIPILLFLWLIAHSRKSIFSKFAATTLVSICVIWLSYTMTDIVHNRVDAFLNELGGYEQGNQNTSVGARLMIWSAAFQLFLEHPVFGLGPNGFAHAMSTLQSAGSITPYVAEMGRAEAHNEILAKCASTGLFGLLSILSIFIVPLYIFLRSTNSIISTTRIAGYMGLCLVLGFFIFGLTVEVFNLKMTATFFSLTLAILMAAATSKSAS
jgi:O-antigen ligase